MYDNLSSSIFCASIQFFEENPTGRILNRFGRDTNTIDDNLPFMINIVLAQIFALVGAFVIIVVSNPFIFVILVIILYVYNRLQSFYRRSSRELRRIESISRSPVYSIYLDCLGQSIVLRSLGSSTLQYFDSIFCQNLDNTIRASTNLTAASNVRS